MSKPLQLIGRAVNIEPGDVAPKTIVFIPIGDRVVSSYRPTGESPEMRVNVTKVSAQRLEASRRQLVAQGREPFFDYGHQELFGGDNRKSGIPRRFWFDDKLGCVADVDWTGPAASSLVGQVPEFDAFSPHAPIDDETGEVLGLYQNAGGLVNRGTFGPAARLSEAAAHQEMIAADPNIVAQIAASSDDEQTAAQEKRMKQLIAKLHAALKITKPVDQVTEEELIAAFQQSQDNVRVLTGRADLAEPVIVALGLEKTVSDVAMLTGRASLVTPVLIALGFDKNANPKPEDLVGKIALLGKPGEEVIAKELIGFAVKTGVLAPAEEADWLAKFGRDRVGWTAELIKKTPSVLIGKVVKEAGTQLAAGAAGTDPKAWEKRVAELIAKDPVIAAVALENLPRAKSMAVEKIAAEEPALLK